MNANLKKTDETTPKRFLKFLLCAPALALMLTACSVEQTEEGELPDVDVQGGNMPEYDVDVPEVDVKTEKKTVTVPDVDVGTEEKEIEVPDIDIITDEDKPDE